MVEQSVIIKAPLARVFDAFADLLKWRRILPDVVDVSMLYEDGRHQEFLMTVERGGQHEQIRGIRYVYPGEKIELFQPNPPPGFKSMTGEWRFRAVDGGTEVLVKRFFSLLDETPAKREEISHNLQHYLQTNLRRFGDYLQNGQD